MKLGNTQKKPAPKASKRLKSAKKKGGIFKYTSMVPHHTKTRSVAGGLKVMKTTDS